MQKECFCYFIIIFIFYFPMEEPFQPYKNDSYHIVSLQKLYYTPKQETNYEEIFFLIKIRQLVKMIHFVKVAWGLSNSIFVGFILYLCLTYSRNILWWATLMTHILNMQLNFAFNIDIPDQYIHFVSTKNVTAFTYIKLKS